MKNNCTTDVTCYVDYAFKRIGGKYKGRILWYLSQKGVLRYGEIGRFIEDATPKMLSQTLKELEHDQLIHREVYAEVPPRVEYTLKESGLELMPFIDHLIGWAQNQVEKERLAQICNKNVG